MPTNDYFDFEEANYPTRAKALSATMRALVAAIKAAFDLFPELAAMRLGATNYAITGGTANSYTASIPNLEAYANFQRILLKIHASNTGASTVNLNTLGARPIKREDGSDVAEGDLPENAIIDLIYNETGNNYVLQGFATSTLTTIIQNTETIVQQVAAAQEALEDADEALQEANDIAQNVIQNPTYETVNVTEMTVVQVIAQSTTSNTFAGTPIQLEIDEDDNVIVDWSLGTSFSLTLDQDVDEMHFINMDAGKAQQIMVEITNTGSYLILAFIPIEEGWSIWKDEGSELFPVENGVTSYGCALFPAQRMHIFRRAMEEHNPE